MYEAVKSGNITLEEFLAWCEEIKDDAFMDGYDRQ